MFSPPGLFRRRYLSGLDWLIGTLDYGMKRRTGAGNASELALLLKGPLDTGALREGLRKFISAFPILKGKIKRDLITLAPYWAYDHKAEGQAPIETTVLNTELLDSEGLISPEALKLASDFVNRPFSRGGERIALSIISGAGGGHMLLMKFDHCLLDARGAETFLTLALENISGKANKSAREIATETPPYSDMGLTGWKDKFFAGQYLNRKFIALSDTAPLRLPLPETHEGSVHPVRYAVLSLSAEEAARAFELAEKRAGFLMEMPYMLASTFVGMLRLIKKRLGQGAEGNIVVPLSMDTRRSRNRAEEIFFNYTSFMFFVLNTGMTVQECIESIKGQMYEQAKEGFPAKIAEAALPMRIAPFGVLDKLIEKFLGAGASTFSFSYVGRAGVGNTVPEGAEVKNLYHLPRVPTPPGLGVFFSGAGGGRLNITASWLSGIIEPADAEELLSNIKEALLGDE